MCSIQLNVLFRESTQFNIDDGIGKLLNLEIVVFFYDFYWFVHSDIDVSVNFQLYYFWKKFG